MVVVHINLPHLEITFVVSTIKRVICFERFKVIPSVLTLEKVVPIEGLYEEHLQTIRESCYILISLSYKSNFPFW